VPPAMFVENRLILSSGSFCSSWAPIGKYVRCSPQRLILPSPADAIDGGKSIIDAVYTGPPNRRSIVRIGRFPDVTKPLKCYEEVLLPPFGSASYGQYARIVRGDTPGAK
jgi:hypothetical protein